MLPEQLQDNLQVFVVLLLILAVHNDVIKVHQYKLANDIFQYIVMMFWNVPGAFVKPKHSTLNSYIPLGVENAALGTSSGLSLTW